MGEDAVELWRGEHAAREEDAVGVGHVEAEALRVAELRHLDDGGQ